MISISMVIVRLGCYSHLYSHINMVFLCLCFSPPFGISSLSQHLQPSLVPPTIHDQPDGITAHAGTKSLHVCDAKKADHFAKGIFHYFGLGTTQGPFPCSPILQFAVSSTVNREHVSEPRQDIMGALMPPLRTGFQNLVIVLFGLLHDSFKADVSSDLVAVLIESE